MTFRCSELLDLARGAPCCVQIPGVCTRDPATVVASHSNRLEHGKGLGTKAHDCYVAFACHACHDAIDGRSQLKANAAQRGAWWRQGFERTILYLWESGLIGVVKLAQRSSRASKPMPQRKTRKDSPTSRPSKILPRRL